MLRQAGLGIHAESLRYSFLCFIPVYLNGAARPAGMLCGIHSCIPDWMQSALPEYITGMPDRMQSTRSAGVCIREYLPGMPDRTQSVLPECFVGCIPGMPGRAQSVRSAGTCIRGCPPGAIQSNHPLPSFI